MISSISLPARWQHWTKVIARYVSVQLLVQAIGFLIGLLTIRTLTKEQYAYFTIANTMQGAIGVLADIGISNAVQLIAGKVWDNPDEFGSLINSARKVRRVLAAVAFCVIGPASMVTLMKNGLDATNAGILTLVLLSGTIFTMDSSLLGEVPKMRGEIFRLQKYDLIVSSCRFICTGIGFLIYKSPVVPIIAVVLTCIVQWAITKKAAYLFINHTAAVNPSYEKTIWKLIYQQAPDTIYYTVQAPVTLWLISWFGKSSTIAELGALGRLIVIINIFNSVVSNILIPKFAKEQTKTGVLHLYWRILALHVLMGGALILSSVVMAKPILWILGNKYQGSEITLFYVTIQNFTAMIGGIIYKLNATRGWNKHAWLSVPVSILAQVIVLKLVNIGTIAGITVFVCLPSIISASVFIVEAFKSFYHWHDANQASH